MSAIGVPFFVPSVVNASSVALSGAKVRAFVPSSDGDPTATPRVIYTDPDCSMPASVPYVMGTSGQGVLYSKPDEGVVFVVKDSGETTSYAEVYKPAGISAGALGSGWESALATALGAQWATILAAASADNVPTLDSYAGATDTAKLQAWVTSGDRHIKLTRNVTLSAEIAIGNYCLLNLGGYTVYKGFNGNMFTMGDYARILHGRIDGVGALYTGNGITISGGETVHAQRLIDVDIINTRGYNVEFSGDGSGASFAWIGGSYYRYDTSLDAIKLPDSDSATTGLRTFSHLLGNGSCMMDVSGGRVTSIHQCNGASITLRDASAYLLTDESRVVQVIDRPAVTGATKANPCVVTAPDHGCRTGDSVTFYDIGGMTELNGNNYTVTYVDADNVSIGVDSSAYTTYTSGGTMKNRSVHAIRGTFHQIQAIQGTTLDGSTVMRYMPAAENNAIDVHPGQTLQDDSGVTTNHRLTSPDTLYIDSSGRLVVAAAVGALWAKFTAAGSDLLTIGNNSSGSHVELASQNNVDLRLGVGTADDIKISTTAITNTLPLVLSGDTEPANDNSQKMGTASKRYSELFAGNGTVNTSDQRHKTAKRSLLDAELRAIRKIVSDVGVFQMLDSVSRKGSSARLHIGIYAQFAAAAFREEGLDPERYSFFCVDPVLEDVEIVEDVEELVVIPPTKRTIRNTAIVQELGQAVQKTFTTEEDVFEYETVPLFDESGNPVMMHDAADENGNPCSRQRMISRPKMELRKVKRARIEKHPKLDTDGNPEVIYGLRPDQLFWLALACLSDGAIAQPPVTPLGYPDEAPDLAAENQALRAEVEALRKELEARDAPVGLPPNPAETKLSDYGEVGGGSETDWLGVPAWLAAEERDGEAMPDRIARLTAEFKARVNELTNLLLNKTITEEQDRERTILLAKYNELAELGDRS